MAAMYGLPEEDEIDLLEYWRILWKNKWRIILFSLFAAVVAAAISLRMPDMYEAEVLLSPVSGGGGKGGGLASALGGLGGLASIAGVSLPGGSNAEQNLAIMKSRIFLKKFIEENNLMPKIFTDAQDRNMQKREKGGGTGGQPRILDGCSVLRGLIKSEKKEGGLIAISVEWKDPEQAAEWANALVRDLNTFLRNQEIARSRANLKYLNRELERTAVADMRKTLFELIANEQKKAMLANTQKQFAFRIIDPAIPPDHKSKPKRSLIVVLSTFVAGFLAVIAVFIREGIARRREEEAAAASGNGSQSPSALSRDGSQLLSPP